MSRSKKSQRANLNDPNGRLLVYLEETLATLPRINNVPICQALTYELIQIVNQLEDTDDRHQCP